MLNVFILCLLFTVLCVQCEYLFPMRATLDIAFKTGSQEGQK